MPNILSVTQISDTGETKTEYHIMKSEKGYHRAHRKGKCRMFCYYCEQEAMKMLNRGLCNE